MYRMGISTASGMDNNGQYLGTASVSPRPYPTTGVSFIPHIQIPGRIKFQILAVLPMGACFATEPPADPPRPRPVESAPYKAQPSVQSPASTASTRYSGSPQSTAIVPSRATGRPTGDTNVGAGLGRGSGGGARAAGRPGVSAALLQTTVEVHRGKRHLGYGRQWSQCLLTSNGRSGQLQVQVDERLA